MRLGVMAENLFERALMAAGVMPVFALTSRSGLWTTDEMASWQSDAGLRPRKPIHLPFAREMALQVADRPPSGVS